VMFATKRGPGVPSAEANRLFYEMEEKFDLMRLKARRADLEREEARLAEEEELLKDGLKPQKNCIVRLCETPTDAAGVRGLWRALAKMKTIGWLKVRREMLAGEVYRLSLLEEEIEFALRLRKMRSPR
jgi:hypothetical protein